MIEFKDITVEFDDKTVFEHFNLIIEKGEKIWLNAPSGSGKSTLFNLLMGFLKAKSGDVIFRGKKISRKNLQYFRSNISYVSQDIDLRDEVIEDLLNEIFEYSFNKNKALDKEKVEELLAYLGLDKGILKKNVSMLSGGERQRIGLIIAILLDREVFILDEITSALDKDMKIKVAQYILGLDKTVLVISHDNIWSEYENMRAVRW